MQKLVIILSAAMASATAQAASEGCVFKGMQGAQAIARLNGLPGQKVEANRPSGEAFVVTVDGQQSYRVESGEADGHCIRSIEETEAPSAVGACQDAAQRAVLRLAQINGIPTRPASERAKLLVSRTNPGAGDYLIEWESADKRFAATTVARVACAVEQLTYNPNP